MFNRRELSEQVHDYVAGMQSLDDFEDWFSAESWNVHQWGSPDLAEAVYAIEEALSRYHFEDLNEGILQQQVLAAVGDVARTSRWHEGSTSSFGNAPLVLGVSPTSPGFAEIADQTPNEDRLEFALA